MAITAQVLYLAGCPNYEQAVKDLLEVLTEQAMQAEITLVAVESPADAERLQFYGSPTIRINGADVAPVSPDLHPALACRLYHTADGQTLPTPPMQAIRAALLWVRSDPRA
jgi:hypothetical protein